MAKSLPNKAVAEMRFFWGTIVEGTFDQTTVASLLLAIRSYVTKKTPTREIGDFIAHSEKNCGEIHNHFEALRFLVDGREVSDLVIGAETKSLAIHLPVPIKQSCFTDDLKRELGDIGIFNKSEIDATIDARAEELFLCYVGILHSATLLVKGKSDAVIKLVRPLWFGKPESHLSLNWVREGTRQTIIATSLLPTVCDFSSFELEGTKAIRAIRGPDGLKLRKI